MKIRNSLPASSPRPSLSSWQHTFYLSHLLIIFSSRLFPSSISLINWHLTEQYNVAVKYRESESGALKSPPPSPPLKLVFSITSVPDTSVTDKISSQKFHLRKAFLKVSVSRDTKTCPIKTFTSSFQLYLLLIYLQINYSSICVSYGQKKCSTLTHIFLARFQQDDHFLCFIALSLTNAKGKMDKVSRKT